MIYHYVYIFQSQSNPSRFYTGRTEDLNERLLIHNQGKCKYTSKYVPWKIKTAIAFTDKQKALDLETYLKSSSGRAFAKRHF